MESSTSEVKGIGGTAIALFIFGLAAIIVVGLFFAIRGYLSKAQENTTQVMDDLLTQTYTQYDDVTQTGTDVLAMIKTNRNSDMVIFVSTFNSNGAYFDPAAPAGAHGFYYCGLPTDADATTFEGDITYSDLGGKTGTVFNIAALTTGTSSNFDVMHNTNFSPMTMQSSAKQYVKTSSKFYSRAIYNAATGDMVGVAFFQLN